jgi:hypothetical protein
MNWIEAKEKMPGHQDDVLCCNANDENFPICIASQVPGSDDFFYIFELGEQTDQVTHWMELPERPIKTTNL